MSLEDIFINVVDDELLGDDSPKKSKSGSRRKYDYQSRTREIGKDFARQLRENAANSSDSEQNDGSADA